MLISPCSSGRIDPIVFTILKNIYSKLPVIPITRLSDYVFNENLNNLNSRYVLVDMCELDWNWDQKDTHIFGQNTRLFKDKFPGEEWATFDLFVKKNPPAIHFIRELIAKDETETIKPVEYPCWHPIQEPVSKEAFDNRPLQVFSSWGFSHEARRRLHGEIWIHAPNHDYMVCDNLYYFDGFMQHESNPKKWVTLNLPHYDRIDISHILGVQAMAKLSVSMSGAGVKCFRHAESPINAIMCLPEDNLSWSYPWVHLENCIRLKEGQEIEGLVQALRREDLYNIYLKGIETIEKYKINNYLTNYLQPLINGI